MLFDLFSKSLCSVDVMILKLSTMIYVGYIENILLFTNVVRATAYHIYFVIDGIFKRIRQFQYSKNVFDIENYCENYNMILDTMTVASLDFIIIL